ncbi:paraquat-inducible protein A [Alteromonas sp. ASW11-130]|uniref:paraquat-inducible protein A n=1 Tax=Alteromonas sp. ASW11-130 TaxID=3015775 RepID=UPI002241CA2E|nr:paraquat-inducible protein A [Alteromonas sp. ASW11-130]MCW8091356.1 paraquat-inducible protein A [Alteromonas sp. ASW11-130]
MTTPHGLKVSCRDCGKVSYLPSLQHKQKAVCPRCGHTLLTYRHNETQITLALAFSAVVLLFLSLLFDFLTFKLNGQLHSLDLWSALAVLAANKYLSLAIITGLATVILPAILLIGVCWLMWARMTHHYSPYLRRVYNMVMLALPWSMAEIFLVGILVSLIKITSLADIDVGPSFYAYFGFTITMSSALFYFDASQTAYWVHGRKVPEEKPLDSTTASTSIQRTWALLLTATLLYIPANILPIMTTSIFGRSEPSTIIGGVIALWEMGSYPIAIIILIASVVVPVAKILILAWLNLSVQSGMLNNPQVRIKYFRLVEWIGRWSMIDVFVVAILVALIQLGNTLSIYPGPAALAFCAVVFVTMLAAITFDARMIWQNRKSVV